MNVDVLAIGAHPDDVELGVGGLLHKLGKHGYTTGILDLTRAEMSTRGTVEERSVEAHKAAEILGVARRENVKLPDAGLRNCSEQQRAVIPYLRSFRAKVLLIPMHSDRHPDHSAAHDLMNDTQYFAGLANIDTGQPPHRPDLVFFYAPYLENLGLPDMVIDISGHFDKKIEALRAYESQFYNPGYPGGETYIASPEFWDSIETRARYWGMRMNVTHAEPLYSQRPIGLQLLPGLEDLE